MNKQINENAQLSRMKALMGYGINESKQPEYSTVEYSKMGADGNLYGIVREGTHYYIKQALDAKGKMISENFGYIGGFRNRKDNMFESFASAQRYLGEKLMNINEEVGVKEKKVIAEAWNIDTSSEIVTEGTKRMQAEIARQREIMQNAVAINESGSCTGKCKQECKPVVGKDATKNSESPKSDAKKSEEEVKDYNGKPIKGGAGAPFNQKPSVNEASTTPLSSRENPDYIDDSHGTQIGKNTGFGKDIENKTENSVAEENGGEAETTSTPNEVNEEVAMHNTDNQNSPSVGTGEKGDTDPFDEKATVTESVDDLDDTLEDEDEDFDFDEEDEEGAELDDFEGEDVDLDDVEDEDVESAEISLDTEDADLGSRISALESKIDSILDALQNMKYDDSEELYDDDEEGDLDDEEMEFEVEPDEEGEDDDFEGEGEDFDEEDDDEFDEVVESKSYRQRLMNEDKLNVFGKHPAYQKKVMTLPANSNPKRDGQYDMNDDSVESEAPYGQQLGDTAPFKKGVERVDNSIMQEAIVKEAMKILKKKLG